MGQVLGSDGDKMALDDIEGIRKWRRKATDRKCNESGFCEGMAGMLIHCTKMHRLDSIVTAIGEDAGRPEAIGFMDRTQQVLMMFNYCPSCGGQLKLQENQNNWPTG